MAKKVIQQETQHGYRTPDGVEHFPAYDEPPHTGPSIGYKDFDTEKGQKETRDAYRKALQSQGVSPDLADGLEFVQRVKTVTMSRTIPLPARIVEDEPVRRTIVKKPRPF